MLLTGACVDDLLEPLGITGDSMVSESAEVLGITEGPSKILAIVEGVWKKLGVLDHI